MVFKRNPFTEGSIPDKAAGQGLEAVHDCLEIPILVLELPDKAMLFEVE